MISFSPTRLITLEHFASDSRRDRRSARNRLFVRNRGSFFKTRVCTRPRSSHVDKRLQIQKNSIQTYVIHDKPSLPHALFPQVIHIGKTFYLAGKLSILPVFRGIACVFFGCARKNHVTSQSTKTWLFLDISCFL